MKGLFGFLIMAIVMVCVSYANATETQPSQDDTALPKPKDVSIIVDRNPKVQELKVYEDGVLTHTMPISTGRETFDFNTGNYKINPYCSFTETNEEFAQTENGKKSQDPSRFGVQRLREMNISDTWSSRDTNGEITSKTRMPHATFFNGGTAFHAVDTDTEYGRNALTKLGPKPAKDKDGNILKDSNGNIIYDPSNGGSGACVRLSPENAKIVFDLFATKKPDGTYEKADPRAWEECQVVAGQNMSHKCTDPDQWPVPRIKQDVEIKIQDSRTPEEQAAAHKKCNDIETAFLADKAKCMKSKIESRPTTVQFAPESQPKKKKGFFGKIFGNFFNSNEQQENDESLLAVNNTPYSFATAWKELPSEERIKYNEECNRLGHEKIKRDKAAAAATVSSPTTTGSTSARPRRNPLKTNGLWQ